jgi:ATP-dependent HslUV protease ATP-binding subunit HslU
MDNAASQPADAQASAKFSDPKTPPLALDALTPKMIVAELDRFIIGQRDAKRAVAVALRNRWRRQQVPEPMRSDISPKNILMIGPTGCGKTEISRRMAKLVNAPFLKVEATKFTEVGYVGRDVDSIIRDLMEEAIRLVRETQRIGVKEQAEQAAENRVLEALVGKDASESTRARFKALLRDGALAERVVELDVADTNMAGMPSFDIPGMPGASMGMINITDMLSKAMGGTRTKRRKMTVAQAYDVLLAEESDKLIDAEKVTRDALLAVEQNGIVFLDEIDKIAISNVQGGSVSREGVQRDLLPLIEGTTVATKYGPVKTDHVLFIASGAFHLAKPSDLLPELQGRLPIRVELNGLTRDDFKRILTETETSLVRQYRALLATEGVMLNFTQDGIDAIADISVQVNESVENIGARRLQTVMEKLLDQISFAANDRAGEEVVIDGAYVHDQLDGLAKNTDLSRFIL